MISVEEVKNFLMGAGADFPDEGIERALALAYERFQKLTGREPDESLPSERRALILLAVIELATQVNMYYRKEADGLIRAKDLVSEVERLLGLSPKGGLLKWQTI